VPAEQETSFDYLAEASLERPRGATDFYSSATPRVQLLKHPPTSGHRGTTPAATLLPGLVMVYVSRPPIGGSLRSVTLLGDLIPN
jgi:hypothetical protein